MADAGGVVYLLSSYQSGKERWGVLRERGGAGVGVTRGKGGRVTDEENRRTGRTPCSGQQRNNLLFIILTVVCTPLFDWAECMMM